MNLFTINIALATLTAIALPPAVRAHLIVWAVFFLCLFCSALGVYISFLVFGTNITGIKKWGIGLAISIVMLGISYGAKFANANARMTFTPVDAIQYLSQGFLWPSTWPALADFLGIQKVIPPPQDTSGVLDCCDKFAIVASLLF